MGIGEDSPADRLVVQKQMQVVMLQQGLDTTTDGSASNPTSASLYLTTSTGDFNTFYIQARRSNVHFGYADPDLLIIFHLWLLPMLDDFRLETTIYANANCDELIVGNEMIMNRV